jgi:hypothetical protein
MFRSATVFAVAVVFVIAISASARTQCHSDFAYDANYLIDNKVGIIVDAEGTGSIIWLSRKTCWTNF